VVITDRFWPHQNSDFHVVLSLVLKMAGILSSPEMRHALWQQLVATDQPLTPPPEHDTNVDLTEEEFDMGDYDEDGDVEDGYDANQLVEF
jgi:hypothetical protein